MINTNIQASNKSTSSDKEWVAITFHKFNITLKDDYLQNCTLRCNKGVIRDRRDLNNALKWEKEVRASNAYHKNYSIKNDEIYDIQEAM